MPERWRSVSTSNTSTVPILSRPQLTVYFQKNPLWVFGSFFIEVIVDRWGEEIYASEMVSITTRSWETDLPPMNCLVRIGSGYGMAETSEWVDVSGGQTKVSLKIKPPAHDPVGYLFTQASVSTASTSMQFSTGNILISQWST